VRTPRLLAVLAALALSLTGCTALPPASPSAPGSADPTQIRQELDALVLGEPLSMAGYSRARFPHWIEQGDGCDTRDVVLKRQGQGVVAAAGNCKITSGSWRSPYDGTTYTDPQKLDIDHVVPLADAWRSGARNWTDSQRQDFANDLTRPQLLAVSLTQNRAKGDQDPSQWKPPSHDFWCQYAEDWVAVKYFWKLTVTVAEKSALTDMLGTCP
jgi:Protein of unknown function (DUF1524)